MHFCILSVYILYCSITNLILICAVLELRTVDSSLSPVQAASLSVQMVPISIYQREYLTSISSGSCLPRISQRRRSVATKVVPARSPSSGDAAPGSGSRLVDSWGWTSAGSLSLWTVDGLACQSTKGPFQGHQPLQIDALVVSA